MSVVSIHQPNYIPYLGFFEKFVHSDVFVILDHVQYTKNGYQNRNQINTITGPLWLTIPVKYNFGVKTNEILIDNSKKWRKQHISSISQNYAKSNYSIEIKETLEEIYSKEWQKLVDINLSLLNLAFHLLDPDKKIIYSSELSLNSSGSDLILEICQQAGATKYLSGKSGKNYLILEDFRDNNIGVIFQEFKHPVYNQLQGEFQPNMAFIDYIFNCGVENFKNIFSK